MSRSALHYSIAPASRASSVEACSLPQKVRVLRLQPAAARPAPIEAAGALRHDPLKAQLAGVGEHDRALGLDRLAEQDAVDAGDQPREPVAPLLERALAEVLAVEAEEVEGDEAGPRAAGLGAQRREVAASVRDGTRPPRRRSGRSRRASCGPPPRSSATCR